METIWTKTYTPEPHPMLEHDINAEVAVIGGGMAGMLTAYYLKQAGFDPILLEASRIGSGQTGKTTAKISAQLDLPYAKLLAKLGMGKTALFALAEREAVEAYRTLITATPIDCDYTPADACVYSRCDAGAMHASAEIAASLGFTVTYTRKSGELPFPIAAAVKFSGQAHFHPLKFIDSLARELTVYEHTPVRRVEGHTLVTDRAKVQAERIVFATHYPFVNFPGLYFARLHQERSYVLALENAPRLSGMYLGADGGKYSFRRYGDYLLLGGGGHRTGEHGEGGSYADLRERAREWFPNSRPVAHWSAQDCTSIDERPYIGRYTPSKDYWYVATGFRKWGMTGSMIAARLLAEQISRDARASTDEKPHLAPYTPLFSPSRFALGDIAGIAKESGQSAKGLLKRIFALPQSTADELEKGKGGIVWLNGHKAGVYKDECGKVYAVEPKCPHLGCSLEWNPDEKSWDCPCHGSRFDYEGRLIDNPAQKNLPPAKR